MTEEKPLYTITAGLDVTRVTPVLWKSILFTHKALENKISIHLFEMSTGETTLVYSSENKESLELLTELLGIKSISKIIEIEPEVYCSFSPSISSGELLILARSLQDDRILPEDQSLWYH